MRSSSPLLRLFKIRINHDCTAAAHLFVSFFCFFSAIGICAPHFGTRCWFKRLLRSGYKDGDRNRFLSKCDLMLDVLRCRSFFHVLSFLIASFHFIRSRSRKKKCFLHLHKTYNNNCFLPATTTRAKKIDVLESLQWKPNNNETKLSNTIKTNVENESKNNEKTQNRRRSILAITENNENGCNKEANRQQAASNLKCIRMCWVARLKINRVADFVKLSVCIVFFLSGSIQMKNIYFIL